MKLLILTAEQRVGKTESYYDSSFGNWLPGEDIFADVTYAEICEEKEVEEKINNSNAWKWSICELVKSKDYGKVIISGFVDKANNEKYAVKTFKAPGLKDIIYKIVDGEPKFVCFKEGGEK